MTVSGATSFLLDRDQLLADAMAQIGVDSTLVTATKTTQCQDFLNMLIKHYELTNVHMWEENEATMFFNIGQSIYNISTSNTNVAGDYCKETTLSTNGTGNLLTVVTCKGQDATNMAIGDNIGVVLDSGSIYWSTIASVNTSLLQVTMTGSLPSSASSGANVFTYTNTTSIPLSISSVRWVQADGTERICYMRGRDEFMMIPQKIEQGSPNQVFFHTGLNFGVMNVWPTPWSSSERLHFSYTRTLDDFVTGTDTQDLPQSWTLALCLNLAVLIAPIFGKDLMKTMPLLPKLAEAAYSQAELSDVSQGSIRIVPAYRDDMY